MLEKDAPALNCVEAILRKRECASPRRGPGIDHAHLDQVKMLIRTREPTASLVHVKPHTTQACKTIVVAQALGQELDEYWIELNSGDITETEICRRKQVSAAADTNHCC